MGNICRSPLGEAILRHQAAELGLALRVDSAGIGDWHVGERSDERAVQVGEGRGYAMTHRARQVHRRDFERFDLIVAMDFENLRGLRCFPGFDPDKVHLARSFDSGAEADEVEDPFYGSLADFELVADQLEAACRGIIRSLVGD